MSVSPDVGREGFLLLAAYIAIQAWYSIIASDEPGPRGWESPGRRATFVVMIALAAAMHRTGRALDNAVLLTEGRVTRVDAYLAAAVLVGLVLNAVAGL